MGPGELAAVTGVCRKVHAAVRCVYAVVFAPRLTEWPALASEAEVAVAYLVKNLGNIFKKPNRTTY